MSALQYLFRPFVLVIVGIALWSLSSLESQALAQEAIVAETASAVSQDAPTALPAVSEALTAHSATPPVPHLAGTYDTGSIAWLLVSAALVFFMMPGLALFYGGIRQRDCPAMNGQVRAFSVVAGQVV